MRVRLWVLVAALSGLVAGVALTRAGEPLVGANVKNLLLQQLSEELASDREVLIDLVEIPPHTTLERHWHPGEEFHYYLEGEVEIAIDGQESIMGTPGTVGHVPYKSMHTAITKDKGARALVFRVHKKGEPVRYLEEVQKTGP